MSSPPASEIFVLTRTARAVAVLGTFGRLATAAPSFADTLAADADVTPRRFDGSRAVADVQPGHAVNVPVGSG